MEIEKSIIDYAMDEDGVQFRNALYASIQDKVSAHIEAAKQNLARNLITTEEVSEEDEEEVLEEAKKGHLLYRWTSDEVISPRILVEICKKLQNETKNFHRPSRLHKCW